MNNNTANSDEQPPSRPHLFQPGQSGNPAGRPKGSVRPRTLLKRLARGPAQEFFARHNLIDNFDTVPDSTLVEALWEFALVQAFKGNTKLFCAIADRLDPPTQVIEQTTKLGFERQSFAEMSQEERLAMLREKGMMTPGAAQQALSRPAQEDEGEQADG